MNDGGGGDSSGYPLHQLPGHQLGRHERFAPYEVDDRHAIAENNVLPMRCSPAVWPRVRLSPGFTSKPPVTNLVFRNCISRNNGQKPDAFTTLGGVARAPLRFGLLGAGRDDALQLRIRRQRQCGFLRGSRGPPLQCDDGSAVGFHLVETHDVTSRTVSAGTPGRMGSRLRRRGSWRGLGSSIRPVSQERFVLRHDGAPGRRQPVDIVGRNETIRTIYGEGCRGVTFTGVIRTDHREPVVIARAGVDTAVCRSRRRRSRAPRMAAAG